MLRISSLLAALALIFVAASAETIVSDSLGNQVSLPLAGGLATADITNTNLHISSSPYTLYVYINNGLTPGSETGADEQFYVNPPNNPPFYGNATLQSTGYSVDFSMSSFVSNTTAGQYLGSVAAPVTAAGLYRYIFTIPVLESVFVNLTYTDLAAPHPVADLITIFITNPATVVGDPQFVGLRGQSFQVHGIDGAIYNIVSEKNTQVNSRFVFLNEGVCPVINGRAEQNCWSHPGSYLGEMSFQAKVDGKIHQALITSGPAESGFASIQLDGKTLSVGDSFTFGDFVITVKSAYSVIVQTESLIFDLSNSDNFINQGIAARKALSKISAHGLLGQTSVAKVYPTATRYIEGEIDDYVIADYDIFGTDFAYNRF